DIAAIERLFGDEHPGVLRDTLVDMVRVGTLPGKPGLTLQVAVHLPGAAPAPDARYDPKQFRRSK
ncbi:hypothetical protein, partial [Pigmentiphaga daeguensis]|uniref:hypothetical protein n=1 Tax=Pigmentiphaga daeguensis TaxID=414049 RepID=UPI0031D140DE